MLVTRYALNVPIITNHALTYTKLVIRRLQQWDHTISLGLGTQSAEALFPIPSCNLPIQFGDFADQPAERGLEAKWSENLQR